ncbi:MAG: fumarylacetoacetate hydrolase family protein, partial [Clostridia bacterium]|nr:fumarylacetoacetate hydrolase family protein [Clostridia bacterium]
MKLYNIFVDGQVHLAAESGRGLIDLSAAGYAGDMDALIRGACRDEINRLLEDGSLPVVAEPVYANIMNKIGKLVCVGLNYKAHAEGIEMKLPEDPSLFSKFDNALAPANTSVVLPPWESSYDYEAELVIVMGKECWNVSEEEAMGYVFGDTCGNAFSLRAAQMRSGQWLIGKTMPGFGPCGPCIV